MFYLPCQLILSFLHIINQSISQSVSHQSTNQSINQSIKILFNCLTFFVPCFVRGLLTGKFKRDDPNALTTLEGTRLGWTSEKPSERAVFATPGIETLRDNENFWKLMDTVEQLANDMVCAVKLSVVNTNPLNDVAWKILQKCFSCYIAIIPVPVWHP